MSLSINRKPGGWRPGQPSKPHPWFSVKIKHLHKLARLHRLKAKGLTPLGDKASLRAMCEAVVPTHTRTAT